MGFQSHRTRNSLFFVAPKMLADFVHITQALTEKWCYLTSIEMGAWRSSTSPAVGPLPMIYTRCKNGNSRAKKGKPDRLRYWIFQEVTR